MKTGYWILIGLGVAGLGVGAYFIFKAPNTKTFIGSKTDTKAILGKLLRDVPTTSIKKGDIVEVELVSGTKYRLASNHNITGTVNVDFTLL